jgi:MFS family permease
VLIAFMVGATIGSMVAGRLMPKLEHYKRVPVLAMPIGIVTMVVFALAPGDLTLIEATLLLAVGGAGVGPMWPATTVIIQNAVPLDQLGIATGTLSFFRQLGAALVVAIFAAIVLAGCTAQAWSGFRPLTRPPWRLPSAGYSSRLPCSSPCLYFR